MLAHGAGAGHLHKNMESIAEAFAEVGLATLRYNFPYMQAGKRCVDRQPVAVDTVVDAVSLAHDTTDLPLFAGGHSFGGRMTSHAAAAGRIDCRGLIFCSFPLHGPKKPSVDRAAHITDINVPMLYLSGTRDDLADADLLNEVVSRPGINARVHWLETANHSYVVLKRTRQNPLDVFIEMAQEARQFVDENL